METLQQDRHKGFSYDLKYILCNNPLYGNCFDQGFFNIHLYATRQQWTSYIPYYYSFLLTQIDAVLLHVTSSIVDLGISSI